MKRITVHINRKKWKEKALNFLAKTKEFSKFTVATNNTVNDGFPITFFNPYIWNAGGSTHWVQCLSLFAASGFFTPLPHRLPSFQNSDK